MADLSRGSGAGARSGSKRLNVIARFTVSARYAGKGLAHAWNTQPNLRIETAIGVAAFLMALWLGSGVVTVVLASVVVLSLELINSAIEALVDLASPSDHPLAARAKDLSAAAVLVASLGALVLGLAVLGPPLLQRLGLV